MQAPYWAFIDLSQLLNFISSRFSTLLDLVKLAGLDETLASTPNVTLAAPTNEALAVLDMSYWTDLSNVDQLRKLLSYHILTAVVNIGNLPMGETNQATLLGATVNISIVSQNMQAQVRFNNANVSTIYLSKWNIMYEIDLILFPPGISPPTPSPGF